MSLNVAGMNHPLKRRQLFLRRHKTDVICLQETHFRKQEEKFIAEVFSGKVIHAPALVKKRVVLIGLSRKVNWQQHECIADPQGRFLILRDLLNDLKWIIVGVYAPHTQKTEFFTHLVTLLDPLQEENIVIMGDLNAVMNKQLDKSNISSSQSGIP